MKNPIIFFGLLSILGWLVLEVRSLRTKARVQPKGTWQTALQDSILMLALLSIAGLLSISFGKPGLAPQYAAWAVIPLQMLRAWNIGRGNTKAAALCGILLLIGIGIVWLWQTPWLGPGALP